jgi:hypothetical protein
MHTYLAYVVESSPGSVDGRVIPLDRNCASVWNYGENLYTPLYDLSLWLLKMRHGYLLFLW